MPITLRGASGVLYHCQDEEVLLEGRAGGGKSVGVCKKFIDACHRWPGIHCLIIRERRSSITESLLMTLESIIGDTHPEVTRCMRENRHSYRIGASEIVLGGLDEPEKIFGTGWDLIYFNEAIEGRLEAWELFARGARNPRLTAARAMPYHQRIADCNPTYPSHWLNQRATKAANHLRRIDCYEDWQRLDAYNSGPQNGIMRRLISVHQDNPAFFDTQAWEWTPEGERYLKSLGTMSGTTRQRMLEGLWVASEGGVFPQFEEARHTLEPFKLPEAWPIYQFYDPGYDHPTGISWVAVGLNGRQYVIDELKESGRSLSEWASAIKRREHTRGYKVVQRYADPHGAFNKTPTGEESAAEQMRKVYGLQYIKWPGGKRGEKVAQVEKMRDTLTKVLKDGGAALKVFNTCTHTINEFQSWRYKRDAQNQMKEGDDQFEDANNDILDGLLGCVAMNLGPTGQRIGLVRPGDEVVKSQDRPWVINSFTGKPPKRDHPLKGMRFRLRA